MLRNKDWLFSWRWKLFVIFITISVVPLVGFYMMMLAATNDYYIRDKETTLLATANIIAGSIVRGNFLTDPATRHDFDEVIIERGRDGGFRVMVIDSMGLVVNDSFGSETGRVLVVPEVIRAIEANNRVNTRFAEESVYAAAAITNADGDNVAAVLIVSSIDEILAYGEEMQERFVLFVLLIVVILTVLVLVISKLVINPLNNFVRVVERAGEGHFDEKIHIRGRDEYSKLGRAFNHMVSKLALSENSREEFVSNVSHELKTPLSSIKVLTESILLMENVPTEMYTEFLKDINSEVDRMNNIINDLLTLVKLDQHELPLNMKPTDINRMTEDTLRRLAPLAAQKDIELFYENIRPVTISADEMKLSLALSNIVENGIKYTPEEGSITVTVDCDHQHLFISVSDTGIGISEEDHPKVFTRFFRADKTRNRETGGTGLGLAISHQTVLLHGGSIRLDSKEGEGSTFLVRIPLRG
ncbi:MAG: HAMP domain-containing histidine kinase [Defluviitaleaceae bacterium]|nr:HAMP domain-containing histidine kinase [Defluviitaleaceae bacterium]